MISTVVEGMLEFENELQGYSLGTEGEYRVPVGKVIEAVRTWVRQLGDCCDGCKEVSDLEEVIDRLEGELDGLRCVVDFGG